jgi:hypothetical protein
MALTLCSSCEHGLSTLLGNTVRTTVTLDPDVKALLGRAVHRSGRPFKTVLNDAVRSALTRQGSDAGARPGAPLPGFHRGPPRVDLTKAMALADELHDQALAEKSGHGWATRPA